MKDYDVLIILLIPVVLIVTLPVWQILRWLLRSKSLGVPLLDVNIRPDTRRTVTWFLWWCLVGVSIFVTFTHFLWSPTYKLQPNLPYLTARILDAFYSGTISLTLQWLLIIYLLMTLSPKLEFRQNGLCWRGNIIKWQQIESYQWDVSKPNGLTIQTNRRTSHRFEKITIPMQYREEVARILEQYLPDKRLA